MTVIKRDGREVKFDDSKIKKAIASAFSSCKVKVDDKELDELLGFVLESLKDKSDCSVSVEEIQDLVEASLMNGNHYAVASHYVKYRDERTRERNKKSEIMKQYYAKLGGKDIANQNANVDEHSFGGRKSEAASVIDKSTALDYYMSPIHSKNHKKNRIYIHDLDSYVVGMHNCLSIPFDHLLEKGFNTRQTDIRPASSISTAFQLVAVLFQLQSLQQFGGVSATHLDWTMVPYVRKSFYKYYIRELKNKTFGKSSYDKFTKKYTKAKSKDISITDKEVYRNKKAYSTAMEYTIDELNQAVEGMYHNLNTLQSRSGRV